MKDRPEGVDSFADEAASGETAREQRALSRGNAPDPLEGLCDLIKATGRPELALDWPVLDALLDLETTDGVGFGEYCRRLHAVGVRSKDLDPALKRRRKHRAAEARCTNQARAQRLAAQRREEAEAAVAEASTAAQAARAELAKRDPVLAMHSARYTSANGAAYIMERGQIQLRVPTRNDIEVTELANFSAVIVANLLDFESPEAKPRMVSTARSEATRGPHIGLRVLREVPAAALPIARAA